MRHTQTVVSKMFTAVCASWGTMLCVDSLKSKNLLYIIRNTPPGLSGGVLLFQKRRGYGEKCRQLNLVAQRLLQIGDDIVRVLQTNGHTNHTIGNTGRLADLLGNHGVGHGGSLLHQRFRIAQRDGQRAEL